MMIIIIGGILKIPDTIIIPVIGIGTATLSTVHILKYGSAMGLQANFPGGLIHVGGYEV